MKKILLSLLFIITFTSCIKIVNSSCGSTYQYMYYSSNNRGLVIYDVYQDIGGCYIRYYYYGTFIKLYI